ncbi:AMP-binding protein [Aeromicrobium sp. Root472D3]|uniref:AMP-binding protein n=1 Tax=Aeromicrobium sp. Root472D3 TaxID=1736540 RepID=UPI0006F8F105|nr:AMP-binding protein [Aeromicrobium sp. Root472D3]KQX75895.1 AMP-dependent synthetase [Aeromicrobium sp. Root472D3]
MPFTSPFPPVDIPDISIVTYLLGELSEDDAHRRAVVDLHAGVTLTYGELSSAVDHFAAAIAADTDNGETVALMGPNSARWVVAYLGALKAGVVVTPVTTLANASEVAKQLTASKAMKIYADPVVLEAARAGAEQAGLDAGAARDLDSVDLSPETATPFVDRVVAPVTQVATLPFSSGTTALPKGVSLTHRNLVANLCQLDEPLGIDHHSAVLGLLPFAHIYGMTVVVNLSLRRRATIVTMRSFDLDTLLDVIERERLTHLPVAPPVMVAIGKSPSLDGRDLSSVRLVLSGAAPLDATLAGAVATRLGCAVRQAYGMTEMSPVSHIAPLSVDNIAPASVGLTVANMTCKLVDPETGQERGLPQSGVSERGELWCKGPNVMLGYLDNPTATATTLDAEGYLHTGDIAVVDSQGAVTIVDRLKELIKYKGYQVAPAEIEGLLLEHPDIADVAVVGDPIGDGDEAPHAYVVVAPGAIIDEDTVLSYVQERVAPYKKVRAVSFIDAVPKSASGKILRRTLRKS